MPSSNTVQTLQTALQAKAKAEPTFRFYSLWDKIFRQDVLREAYRRCRANHGAPGVDGVSFAQIEERGAESWLGEVRQELIDGNYRPQPLLRVWIPKSNGGQRPLGIPTVKDRVVQMALLLVIGPIFEMDLLPQQYGFRAGLDAKLAVRRTYFTLAKQGIREVVDADLSDYFNTIPHGALMRCVSRRIADGKVLHTLRQWLQAPVVERGKGGERRSTAAKDHCRGTPQGGVVSPLLANLYFRRFLLAWYGKGHAARLGAHVVNYADDFVILCPLGRGQTAMQTMQRLMTQLGLTVNLEKTRLVHLPEESFDFLGYTIGRFFGKGGRPYWGTCPSKRSVHRLRQEIHDITSVRWSTLDVESRVERLNQVIGGWANYFDQGPVGKIYQALQRYAERRLRIWLMRKQGRKGTGYRQYPDQFLYEHLGLIRLRTRREGLSNAKA